MLDALGNLADQDIPDPDSVSPLTLQGAAVVHIAPGVWRIVVDEQPMLQMLTGVREVKTQQLRLTARISEVDRRGDAHHVTAEADQRLAVACVAAVPERAGAPYGRCHRPSPAPRPA